MNLSLTILIIGCVALVVSLLHCFFGYKLGRFLLPVCGLALIEGILYVFVYDLLKLDTMSTWIFFVGGGIAIYLILFFFKRFASFFTGMAGGAVFLLFVIYTAGLQQLPLIYPIFLTLCVLSGLLTFVYERVGVVIFTSLFGGCTAAFLGLYLYLVGVDGSGFVMYGNLLVPFEFFLISNAYLIGGVSIILSAIGLFVQFYWTARVQLLSNRMDNSGSFKLRRRNNVADVI